MSPAPRSRSRSREASKEGKPSLLVGDISKEHGVTADIQLRGRQHLVFAHCLPETVGPPAAAEFPLLLHVSGVALKDFGKVFGEAVEEHLIKSGCCIARGLPCATPDDFSEFVKNLGGKWKEKNFAGGGTYRKNVKKNVRVSSAEPSVVSMEPHMDIVHKEYFPGRITFMMHKSPPPNSGGQTVLTNMRKVTLALEQAGIVELFEKKGGITYQKLYWSSAFLPECPFTWQNMFYTEDKAEVEKEVQGTQWKWLSEDRLEVNTTLPAMRTHPLTGECLWTNGAHTNHKSYYEEAAHIDTTMGSPMHTLFGNGEEIPVEVIEKIRSVLWSESAAVHLRNGDIVLVDNRLTAHGRIGWAPEVPRELLLVHYED